MKTTVSVDVDIDDVIDEISTEDLIDILGDRMSEDSQNNFESILYRFNDNVILEYAKKNIGIYDIEDIRKTADEIRDAFYRNDANALEAILVGYMDNF
jgi:hypothetical protein